MPRVIIPDRICPHCGGNEWYIFKNSIRCNLKIKEGRSKYKKSVKAKDKRKERYRILIQNPEYVKKQKEIYSKWYLDPKNKEKRKQRLLNAKLSPNYRENKKKARKAYRSSEKGKIHLKKQRAKMSENLTVEFVKNRFQQDCKNLYKMYIDRKTITPEMIDKYRQAIKAKRQLRQLKNENK